MNTEKGTSTEKLKYVFEYGANGGATTDLYLTLDESELTTILQSGQYKMTLFLQENDWIFVELYENNESKDVFGYFMKVSGLKESYDLMFRFAGCSNVKIYSEYEPEILKEMWSVQHDFKNKNWSELKKIERVKLNSDFEKDSIPITQPSRFNNDIPF